MQTDERLAKLETKAEAIEKELNEIKFDDIKEIKKMVHDIQTKLNGYLESRIKTHIEAFIGRILLGTLMSSGALAALISWLFARR